MRRRKAAILVAAGTNGAGKTSIVQPFVANSGGAYFNPDEYARSLVARGVSQEEANSMAWARGYHGLVEAIEQNRSYAFETTLGGRSIAYQLMRALAFGRRVTILYVGLASVELHLRRVAERVKRGGHDIPEARIRERYDASRSNLVSFIGTGATIRFWDNSEQSADGRPSGALEVFSIRDRRLVLPPRADLQATVAWARPLLAQALKLGLRRSGSRR